MNRKIANLAEYYKFHSEIPRLFMKPLFKIINAHHN